MTAVKLLSLTDSQESLAFDGDLIISSCLLQMSDTKQAPKTRGPNTSRRRNGRKQKLSSKHDVSSEDDTAGSQHQQHVAV
jgi:hypothetical protein